jgi:hypothetical protein
MLKAGVFFPAGTVEGADPIFYDGYMDIQDAVGGLFTTVENEQVIKGQHIALTGFLPDEVYERDETTMNWFASALFGYELHGPCVVAWHLSPNGFKDGDVYDMPDYMTAFLLRDFVNGVVSAYSEATAVAGLIGMAIQEGVLSEVEATIMMEYIEASTEGELDDMDEDLKFEVLDLMNRIEAFAIMKGREARGK